MDFLNPTFYDVADITDDMPNKPLLIELFQAMNEQNERLWMFFEEIDEDPQHKVMKPTFIKPRTLRRKRAANKKKYSRDLATGRMVEKDEDEAGYKNFLKEEGFEDLL